MTKTYSLYNALNDYGFSNNQQKSALESLMQQASILGPVQSIQDKFPLKHSYDEFLGDILEFVKLTQQHFTIRSGNQERWEITPTEWMTKNQLENLLQLEVLGMTSPIGPKEKSIDAICVFGATNSRMQNRMDYAAFLIKNGLVANNLILLAGERHVTAGVDGTRQELIDIANSYQFTDLSQLTETHLIQKIYDESDLYDQIPTYVINTPRGDLPRPTTQTTIYELLDWLKLHDDIKTIIFISNQPYVKYQEAVIKEIMRGHNSTIAFEVIGADYNNNDVQPVIEALGSFIFAVTPSILIQSGKKVNNPALIDSFRGLYAKQPLVYQSLENNLFGANDAIMAGGYIEEECL